MQNDHTAGGVSEASPHLRARWAPRADRNRTDPDRVSYRAPIVCLTERRLWGRQAPPPRLPPCITPPHT